MEDEEEEEHEQEEEQDEDAMPEEIEDEEEEQDPDQELAAGQEHDNEEAGAEEPAEPEGDEEAAEEEEEEEEEEEQPTRGRGRRNSKRRRKRIGRPPREWSSVLLPKEVKATLGEAAPGSGAGTGIRSNKQLKRKLQQQLSLAGHGSADEGGQTKAGPGGSVVGQIVHGVVDGCFDAGFLISLRVGDSDSLYRGVIFGPGLSLPVSRETDVAKNVKRRKRRRIVAAAVDSAPDDLDNGGTAAVAPNAALQNAKPPATPNNKSASTTTTAGNVPPTSPLVAARGMAGLPQMYNPYMDHQAAAVAAYGAPQPVVQPEHMMSPRMMAPPPPSAATAGAYHHHPAAYMNGGSGAYAPTMHPPAGYMPNPNYNYAARVASSPAMRGLAPTAGSPYAHQHHGMMNYPGAAVAPPPASHLGGSSTTASGGALPSPRAAAGVAGSGQFRPPASPVAPSPQGGVAVRPNFSPRYRSPAPQ